MISNIMEVVDDHRHHHHHHHHHQGMRRVCRETSPEQRSKTCARPTTFKKVQVLYYLSRNGHLEHPHYIQLTHLAHQPLQLKDFVDRLTVLRGKGMPSLYSWSCKRSYKNGYVWNDLALNDVIYPSEGGEYVLKGSELVVACTEKLHHLQIGNNIQEFQDPKRKCPPSKRQTMLTNQYHHGEEIAAEEEEECEAKIMHARCSRGVSTEEFKEKTPPTEINLDANSFSSTTSPTLSDKSNNETPTTNNLNDTKINNSNVSSKRFEDGDPVVNEPMLSRNSMLYSLIACGGSGSFRKTAPSPPCTAARKSGSGVSLHKGVVCKAAAKVAVEEEEDVMIRYMPENPRFGNLQSEEKEYFSGSIVESMTTEERLINGAEPVLKKSSSYNQERSCKAGLGEEAEEEEEEEVKREKGVRGKCIPRKKSSSSKPPKK